MRAVVIALVAVSLIPACELDGQQTASSSNRLRARISYHNTFYQIEGESHAVCFALYEDSSYRLLKTAALTGTGLAGRLSNSQQRELDRALEKLDFQTQRGGLVLEGLEAFRAEVLRQGRVVQYDWVDPDHARPFPRPVEEIIDWLEGFQPRNAVPFEWRELSDWSVCPPPSVEDLQPSVARLGNEAETTSAGAGRRK